MRHEVTRITVDHGRVTGVVATDPQGATLPVSAPIVVAAGDIKRTFLDLLDPADVPRRLQRKVRGYQMALPLAVLNLVIDRDLAAEGLRPTNYVVYPHDDLEGEFARARRGGFSDEPAVFVSSASLKDRDNPRLCPQGHTNLQLLTVAPPQPSSWGLEMGKERGEAYRAKKDGLSRRMLKTADRAVPGLSDSLVYADLSTPYTHLRYMGVTDGTSYGIAATPDQVVESPRTGHPHSRAVSRWREHPFQPRHLSNHGRRCPSRLCDPRPIRCQGREWGQVAQFHRTTESPAQS